MALVERRRLAGTLLYGRCAPHEVDWSRQIWEAFGGPGPIRSDSVAHFVGYDTYLKVAKVAGDYWRSIVHDPTTVVPTTAVQTQQVMSFAETALALISMPRPEKHIGFPNEAMVISDMRRILKEDPIGVHRAALAAALGRLEASGVIAERGLQRAIHESLSRHQQAEAKKQADNEALGLRACAHCGASEVHVAQFKRCSACKGVVFCSKDCQLANWPAHKAACKAARKAAATGAAGGA